MSATCVFAGSFDPVTLGHLDLIRRVSVLFDRVTVTVMNNISKKSAIRTVDRIMLLEKACRPYTKVRIDAWDGLLADYMRSHGETILIRGVRNTAEYEHEYSVSLINRKLYPEMETLLIPSDPVFACVSSSAVRELISFGGCIDDLVPESVKQDITDLLSKTTK